MTLEEILNLIKANEAYLDTLDRKMHPETARMTEATIERLQLEAKIQGMFEKALA